ncbi:hypothetical protein JRO89_XS07G0252600 [Xanthoceras sorbifolium]|uniref:Tf2-1-like SH3-like domain-containing protein n=1 Tax=Xanthoceras sorbifolium TaxID=99658 RepID=A0ABQ8HUX6_9ROSI|nr:hypothetical protein JRO89_XS07G0252600 [Xanthoceras sorbifolium]
MISFLSPRVNKRTDNVIGSLQALDVSNNQLSSIPNEFITSCGGIDGLNLLSFSKNSRNHFDGSIPTNRGKSKALEQLDLSVNNFQGSIPEQLADYGNLTLTDLSVNNLSGFIPGRIGELSKLEVLILSSNNLNGGIPANFSNIATLSRFAANQNHFRGPIPGELTRYLKNLDLSYNKLSGSIPPDLLSQPNLQTVDMSFNLLKGTIPKDISSSLVRLRLGSNSLSREIPSLTCGKLTYLELENNSFSGMIPHQLGSCQNLTLLNLSHNKLKGPLSGQVANLRHLQLMKLEFNKLNGEIPTQFWQLQVFYVLNISYNSLTGSIPSSISYLQTLTNLYLQGNNLSGTIPNSISYLGSLIELQLGENILSGKIPMMPTKLQIALNLSSNLFEGFIPDSLRQLTGLEILDLSNNEFSASLAKASTTFFGLFKILARIGLVVYLLELPPGSQTHDVFHVSLLRPYTSAVAPRNAIPSVVVDIPEDHTLPQPAGAIPEQSADYGNLTLIDISVNHLSGFISDRIGELYKLEGTIPKDISQSLIRLRLGSNSLSGEILYLTCGRLTYLELENNSFSRMIPQQLDSAELEALCEALSLDEMGVAAGEIGPVLREEVDTKMTYTFGPWLRATSPRRSLPSRVKKKTVDEGAQRDHMRPSSTMWDSMYGVYESVRVLEPVDQI